MDGKLIHLRIPESLHAKCIQLVKSNGFGSVQELTREALRQKVNDYETSAAIERLRANMGTSELKRLSPEEKEKCYQEALKMTKKERLELLRKFGLEDIPKL